MARLAAHVSATNHHLPVTLADFSLRNSKQLFSCNESWVSQPCQQTLNSPRGPDYKSGELTPPSPSSDLPPSPSSSPHLLAPKAILLLLSSYASRPLPHAYLLDSLGPIPTHHPSITRPDLCLVQHGLLLDLLLAIQQTTTQQLAILLPVCAAASRPTCRPEVQLVLQRPKRGHAHQLGRRPTVRD